MEDRQSRRPAYDPTHDPTLAQFVEEERGRRGVGLPASLAVQIVSEIAVELDLLHGQGRTHGDVRAARIAVPPVGPAYLRESERPPGPTRTGDDGDVILYSLEMTISEDVLGLVTAAYFAFSGTPPDHLFSLPLPGSPARRACAPDPRRPGPALPAGVFDVLAKGLGQPRGNRYASAGAFAEALRAAAASAPPPPGTPAEALRTRLRTPSPVSPLVVRALRVSAGAALLALGMWLGHRQPSGPMVVGAVPPAALLSAAVPLDSLPTAVPTDSLPQAPPAPPWHARRPAPTDWAAPPMPSTDWAAPPMPLQGRSPRTRAARPSPVRHIRNLPPADSAPLRLAADSPATRLVSVSPPFRSAPALLTRRGDVSRGRTPGTGCYLRVYARQFFSKQDLLEDRPQVVRPQRVLVDGSPSMSLAAGRWTPLAPGLHRLAFYPTHGSPFDANANIRVRLDPGRHSFQIPLPRRPHDAPPVAPQNGPVVPAEQGREARPAVPQGPERSDPLSDGIGGGQPEAVDILSLTSPETFPGKHPGP